MSRLLRLVSFVFVSLALVAPVHAQNERRFAVTDVVGLETPQRESCTSPTCRS